MSWSVRWAKKEVEKEETILLLTVFIILVSKLNVNPRKFVFYDQSNIKVFFNTDKECNSANPTWVGFVQMHERCYLVTRDVFYVTFY